MAAFDKVRETVKTTLGADERVLLTIERDAKPWWILSAVLAIPTLGISLLLCWAEFSLKRYTVTTKRIIFKLPLREESISLTTLAGVEHQRNLGMGGKSIVVRFSGLSRAPLKIMFVKNPDEVVQAITDAMTWPTTLAVKAGSSALDILKERYARGEITEEEFERKRVAIQ